MKRMKMSARNVAAALLTVAAILFFSVPAGASYPKPKPVPALGNNIRKNMTIVQRSQLGYTGTKRYSISPYGGETVYSEYVRQQLLKKGRRFPVDTEHVLWCSEFATWCARRAGTYEGYFYPCRDTDEFRIRFAKMNCYWILSNNIHNTYPECKAAAQGKVMKLSELRNGDILQIRRSGSGNSMVHHTGTVESVRNGVVVSLDGNSGNVARRVVWSASEIKGVIRPLYARKLTLTVKKTNDTTAELTWTPVNDDRLVAKVYRMKQGKTFWKHLGTVKANALKFVDRTRKKNSKYCYRIVLHSRSGNREIVVKDINGLNVDSTSKFF